MPPADPETTAAPTLEEAYALLRQVQICLRQTVPTPRLLTDTREAVGEFIERHQKPVQRLIARTSPPGYQPPASEPAAP